MFHLQYFLQTGPQNFLCYVIFNISIYDKLSVFSIQGPNKFFNKFYKTMNFDLLT